jgi:bifunctional DNase/RNase
MAADAIDAGDLVRVSVHGVLPDQNTDTHIVILRDQRQAEVLPIWVGAAEGNAIKMALDGTVPARPMSHDLMRSFAEHLNVKVTQAVITEVKSNTYYAKVHVATAEGDQQVDSRPSDAIALALRTNSPIFVTQDVLRQRGGANLDAWLERFGTKNLDK